MSFHISLNILRLVNSNSLPNRLLIPSRCMAGHSKWANIRHIKALKDGQRSKEFTRLAQQIRIAIQEGKSANPIANLQLTQAIEIAKKRNMPNERIQSILKVAQNSKSPDQSKPILMEVKGPGTCRLIISLLTDNFTRSKHIIQQHLKKANCSVSTDSGIKHFFDHKGIIKGTIANGSLEKSLDHAIEAGAEEVTFDEELKLFVFTCEPKELFAVHKKLKIIGYDIHEAEDLHIPNTLVELNDQQLQLLSVLFDKLQDIPEVVNIYDNIA